MSQARYRLTLYAILLIFLFSCQKKDKSYPETIAINDVKLTDPRPGSWRYNHDEKFQKLEDFQNSKKIIPEPGKNIIYLQPIGSFNQLQQKELQLTREYLNAYYQLETKILPALPNSIIAQTAKRISKEGHEQVLASYVLNNILIKRKPKDGVVLMGITERDLYPRPEWNYVFGFASYEDGAGVTSLYRFANGNLTESNFNESLLRLMKISSHEIGHMFGISHCLNANCVMSGTNSLSETDFHFARACSLCQQKMNSSIRYDPEKRLTELKKFFENQDLNAELTRAEADWNLLK
ncbi:archaemetzincin [Chryseobacterium indologenes]|uniref:Zn-dependent protease n=1 Tax=Chryseobacterium indologenes TaxID=253 RepID=A0A0N0ZWD9_CHRID|nr:archaemetzincin [Chryseobacterium indologenes]KPE49705.1 Zn-dependent protease [Chryseobacterium indologenes]